LFWKTKIKWLTDKLHLTGQNLGRVLSPRRGQVYAMQLRCFEAKRPSLKLKTQPKQLISC
jgi:hypothetical protein